MKSARERLLKRVKLLNLRSFFMINDTTKLGRVGKIFVPEIFIFRITFIFKRKVTKERAFIRQKFNPAWLAKVSKFLFYQQSLKKSTFNIEN